MKEIQDVLNQISELNDKMKIIEEEIKVQTEILKELYSKFSLSMKESQNYLLTGIQTAPVSKSYLVTFRGIEVLGEETIPIPTFIDNVIRFANYPKRRIEVLKELAIHLDGLRSMIATGDGLLDS
ncbi:MAG TPA: hypothetical protein VGK47_09490 [Nitrososphaeraceae archaeon]